MYWSTERKPVSLDELGWINTSFLGSASAACDPMLVWGTTVDTDGLDQFIDEQKWKSGKLVSPAHVLIQAVSQALIQHPEVNRRIIAKRVHQYKGVNVVMPMRMGSAGEVDCVFIRGVEQLSLGDIVETMWNAAREKAHKVAADKKLKSSGSFIQRTVMSLARWIRLHWIHKMSTGGFLLANWVRMPTIWKWQDLLNGANAFVNYLGAPGTPPLICHKPAVLPMNSYSIYMTMGPSEPKPVVVDGQVVIRKQAPLFCRLDHRFVNGFQAGAFMNTVRTLLANPWSMQQSPSEETRRAA